jgi:hypothetical protein
MTNLLKKDINFIWGDKIDNIFRYLKEIFIIVSILRYFDHSRSIILEANISNKILDGIISQYNDDDILYPYIFHNYKFNPIEWNYEIYDKEILIIMEYMDLWRYYFEDINHPLKVLIDHKNLI